VATFVDDFSAFACIYPLAAKSDTFHVFQEFCQVQVYSGRGSSQVWTKADDGGEQRAGQEVSLARVGDHLDSTTKDNER